MVNASRAWKYAQPRCMTFLRWQTNVSMESTVSTSIRSCHSPRGHHLRLAGSPAAAWTAGTPCRGMEGGIPQDNHPPINLLNQPLKGVIRDIGDGTRPPHDQPPLIEEESEFTADNTAMSLD